MKKCKYCGTTENLVTRKVRNQFLSESKLVVQNICKNCFSTKMKEANKNKKVSEETKQLLSIKIKELFKDPEYQKKHSEGQKRRYLRKDQIVLAQERGKSVWNNEEFCVKKSTEFKERWTDDNFRSNKSNSQKKYMKNLWKDETYRNKMCSMSKDVWGNMDLRKKMSLKHKNLLKGKNPFSKNGLKPTKPQMELFNISKSLFLDSVDDKTIVTKVSRRYPDVFIPSLNLILEYDGSYFHKENNDRDIKRDNELNECGYKLIHYIDKVPSYLDLMRDVRESIILNENSKYIK